MAGRPAGIVAFNRALHEHTVVPARYRTFEAPVLYTYGGLSHPRWAAMRDRLAGLFTTFQSELYEELHHLNPAH
jgi:hypothetical protein